MGSCINLYRFIQHSISLQMSSNPCLVRGYKNLFCRIFQSQQISRCTEEHVDRKKKTRRDDDANDAQGSDEFGRRVRPRCSHEGGEEACAVDTLPKHQFPVAHKADGVADSTDRKEQPKALDLDAKRTANREIFRHCCGYVEHDAFQDLKAFLTHGSRPEVSYFMRLLGLDKEELPLAPSLGGGGGGAHTPTTLLHLACEHESVNCIVTLLELKASPNVMLLRPPKEVPLHVAVARGSQECARILLEHKVCTFGMGPCRPALLRLHALYASHAAHALACTPSLARTAQMKSTDRPHTSSTPLRLELCKAHASHALRLT
jgi:hypothetical protein